MRILKVFNNNVASVENEDGQEIVIIGKGISFGKKAGDRVNITNAVKIFEPANRGMIGKLSKLVESIPEEHVRLCNEIVGSARDQLGPVTDKIFLTLIDHISFAIERYYKQMDFGDIVYGIRELYPQEYEVGLNALDIIEKRLGIRLPETEAGFIAFHFLNAAGTELKTARDNVALIENILCIVRKYVDFDTKDQSTCVARFMTHLRFFVRCIVGVSSGEMRDSADNEAFFLPLDPLPSVTACVAEVVEFVEHEYGYVVSRNEINYLIIHVQGMMNHKRQHLNK